MESSLTPYCSAGIMRSRPSPLSYTAVCPPLRTFWAWTGRKCRRQAIRPCSLSSQGATARLAATVLLPTPPLPELIPIMFLPGQRIGRFFRIVAACFYRYIAFDLHIVRHKGEDGRFGCFDHRFDERIGGAFKIRENETLRPSIRMSSSTMSRSTMFCPLPG